MRLKTFSASYVLLALSAAALGTALRRLSSQILRQQPQLRRSSKQHKTALRLLTHQICSAHPAAAAAAAFRRRSPLRAATACPRLPLLLWLDRAVCLLPLVATACPRLPVTGASGSGCSAAAGFASCRLLLRLALGCRCCCACQAKQGMAAQLQGGLPSTVVCCYGFLPLIQLLSRPKAVCLSLFAAAAYLSKLLRSGGWRACDRRCRSLSRLSCHAVATVSWPHQAFLQTLLSDPCFCLLDAGEPAHGSSSSISDLSSSAATDAVHDLL